MCTGIRFTSEQGGMFFGRNLDWSGSYGEQVVLTPRGYLRKWAYGPEGRSNFTPRALAYGGESSMHAVIGMGIVVGNVPLYFDCANEAGLAVAGLNFPGFARFEQNPLAGKVNVAAYEFPLWVTSNFDTVDQLEAALREVAIVAKPVDERYGVSLLHWLIGDANRSIVVEYGEEGMRVHHDEADVLANQPGFEWQQENLRNYLSLTSRFPKEVSWRGAKLAPYGSGLGMRGLPGDYSSPSRFVRAAYLNAHHPAREGEGANVLRLFHTLGGVAMVDGAAQMESGFFEKTVYTGGYSAQTRTYYFNTYDDPAIKYVSMADVSLQGGELLLPEPKLWPALA